MFDWLRCVGLKPREFTHLIHATRTAAPDIWDAVRGAFDSVQAVIALFTPVEYVADRTALQAQAHARRVQAPLNVVLEAGIALDHPPRPHTSALDDGELHPDDLAKLEVGSITNSSRYSCRRRIEPAITSRRRSRAGRWRCRCGARWRCATSGCGRPRTGWPGGALQHPHGFVFRVLSRGAAGSSQRPQGTQEDHRGGWAGSCGTRSRRCCPPTTCHQLVPALTRGAEVVDQIFS